MSAVTQQQQMEAVALSPRTPSTVAASPSADSSIEKRRQTAVVDDTTVQVKLAGVFLSDGHDVSDAKDELQDEVNVPGTEAKEPTAARAAAEKALAAVVVAPQSEAPSTADVCAEMGNEKAEKAEEAGKVEKAEESSQSAAVEGKAAETNGEAAATGSGGRHEQTSLMEEKVDNSGSKADAAELSAPSADAAPATSVALTASCAVGQKMTDTEKVVESVKEQQSSSVPKPKAAADSPEVIVGADGKKRKLVKREPKPKPTVFENKPAPSSAHTGALRSSPTTAATQTRTVFENSPTKASVAHASTLRPAETKPATKTVFESAVVPTKADAGTFVPPKPTATTAAAKTVFENVPKPSAATAAAVVAAPPPPQTKSIYETVPAPSKAHASWREHKAPVADGRVEFTNVPQPRAGVMRWDSALPAVAQNQTVFESQPAPTRAHASALRPHKDVDAGSEYSYETVSEDEEVEVAE